MSKKGNGTRTYNISVVGLSGLDRDQSLYGVGKSCLCNRFVRPLADDFIPEHTSVFSSSDFGGRVINGDQYLFWGTTTKTTEDGSEFSFNVIEQTELIDDASLMPLSRGGQLVPYPKRATASKLSSAEKLMYISRDQVALQNDYEQVLFPSGKVNIDGFLVLYDVEATNAKRLEDTQEKVLSAVITYVQKSKRPFVIVASKCDDTQLSLLQEVYRFAQTKKLNVPIVETSTYQNVNVDLAFVVLAQLIEKGKVRSRLVPYNDAHKAQQEIVDRALHDYQALINRTVTDFRCLWKNLKKVLELEKEFTVYKELNGSDACKRVFSKHIRKLRREFELRKLDLYLQNLPQALDELLPTLTSIDLCQNSWTNCKAMFRNSKDFSKWMIVLPDETSWNESDHLISDDSRIPFDVLSLPESNTVFQHHVDKLKAAEKRARMKNEFRKLLELTPQIRPGSLWHETEVLLRNEESYKYLDNTDKLQIFDNFLRDIAEQAKLDFQELLFESAGIFSKFEPNSTPSEDDMEALYATLSLDERYRRLDKLESIRKIRVLNHIALLHSPTRCLCGPDKCRDRLMQEIVATTAYRPEYSGSDETLDSEDNQLTICLLGSDELAQELDKEIQSQCSYGDGLEFVLDGRMYELDLRVVDGDVDLPQYALTTTDVAPNGYFFVYSSPDSLEYVHEILDEMYCKSRYNSVDDSTMVQPSASITIILAKNPDMEDMVPQLRRRGADLAERYGASFVDIPLARYARDKIIHDTQIVDAMRNLVEDMKQQARKLSSCDDIGDAEPDLRIMLCAMCGDPYPVELIFGPLLHHQSCWRSPTSPDTIILETFVGFEKRRVQITLTSYHRAYSLNYQMFHGYILVYSAIRKASLETLSAFASSIAHVPIQVLAMTGSASGASVVFHSNDVPVSLLAEGVNLASKLCAKFQTTSPRLQNQGGLFASFFNRVWNKKGESESAYAKFITEQQKRYERKQDFKRRSRHDPLPEIPNKPVKRSESHRPRSVSEHLAVSPRTKHRLSTGNLDDASPYAEFTGKQLREGEHLTSTPNALFTNHNQKDANGPKTPLNITDEWEKRELGGVLSDEERNEGLYARIDKTKKKMNQRSGSAGGGDVNAMNESEVNLIENSLYANKNLAPAVLISGDSRGHTPPPLPHRMYNLDEDFGYMPNDSGVDTLQSNDPGYSTIPSELDQRYRERVYEEARTQPNGTPKVFSFEDHEDPYALRVRDKIKMFDEKQQQEVWVRRTKTREHRNSVPDLVYRQNRKAPLAQQEDDEDPAYAHVQDDSTSNMAQAASLHPTKNNKKANMMVRKKNSLRSAHSAEELSTLERITRRGTERITRRDVFGFRRPRFNHSKQDGNNSDGGTGDEDSLSRKEDRNRSKLGPFRRPRSKRGLSPGRFRNSTPAATPEPSLKSKAKSKKNKSRTLPMTVDSNEESSDTSSLENKKKNLNKYPVKNNADRLLVPPRNDLNDTEEETEEDVGSPSSSLTRNKNDSLSKKQLREAAKQKKREEKILLETERRLKKLEKEKRKRSMSREKKKKAKTAPGAYFGRSLQELCDQGKLVPLFVEKCIDFVEAEGMQIEGIYRKSGKIEDIRTIQNSFDEKRDADFSALEMNVHAVTGALKKFLKLLPEPLIPNNLQNNILDATVIMDADERLAVLRGLVMQLPKVNFAVLKYLMCHLNRVTEYSKENLMESRNLATVIFPTILRTEFESLQTMARTMNYGLFIQTCIEKCEYMFDEES
ncbi:rho GTPase-activating protein 5-like isoform X3 [Nematostella vectensis]|uniref:rho GTPase-activating protein 5-like isoform X3 n=1 Tax=Nematostella vectensis TaxID=45351 RepID=UPI0020771F60|nr:rho GTPase-activating protein 5-like isoform X3 [Nematostella vectensis]